MATHSHPHPHKPLIDPDQMEQAGRRLRQWLDGLAGHHHTTAPTVVDDIEWEDGEPHQSQRPTAIDH